MLHTESKKTSDIIEKVLTYVFLVILSAFVLYPVLYVILGSFKSNIELVSGGINLFPEVWLIDNYVEAWTGGSFGTYTINSVFLSFWSMVGMVLVTSLAGYCFARRDFKFKGFLYSTLIAFMFINVGSTSIRPLFELAVDIGMHQTLWSVVFIIVGHGQASNIFLVRGYMASVPRELDEAATLDGCSFFQIYYRIILPLLKPVLATVALLSFRSGWNEYILAQVFSLSNFDMRPLTAGVIALKSTGDGAAAWNTMFAGSTISIVPIIVVYICFSRYFMSGLTVGAVKS